MQNSSDVLFRKGIKNFQEKDFVKAENLADTLALYMRTIINLERNNTYMSKNPYAEPMLGKRGLYPKMGGDQKQKAASKNSATEQLQDSSILRGDEIEAMMWVLFYSDGQNSIMDIAEKTKMPVSQIFEKAELLLQNKLLKLCD